MELKERRVKIEETLVNTPTQMELEEGVIGITVSNEGDATPYVGWNQKAMPGKGLITTSKSYGLGWPYFIEGQKINIAFSDDGTTRACLVTKFYDDGPRPKC